MIPVAVVELSGTGCIVTGGEESVAEMGRQELERSKQARACFDDGVLDDNVHRVCPGGGSPYKDGHKQGSGRDSAVDGSLSEEIWQV
ncbi:hypothetical protein PAXINDRAFT_171620 [Paxillus involutus ATCC 200175]|jgi:hypothetical protein|uniref:Uncharacterized protein n=1 Tax=Paxillus involutus ATCC 200175 TaxID=664439 RepID=A0A0C9TWT5_PAXIN|nr:hypothetical protein PAXINDRAFT_171620 [Paxillus involutus ATCC 200175]